MNKIIGLKLVTGEEIIGERVESAYKEVRPAFSPIKDKSSVRLRRPVVVGPGPNGQIQFFKWPTVASTEVHTIYQKNYIGEPFEIHKEVEDAYISMTSGIALTSK